jgi:hypothetical protein
MADAIVDFIIRASAGGWSVYKDGQLAAEVVTLALALTKLDALRSELLPGTRATLNAGLLL